MPTLRDYLNQFAAGPDDMVALASLEDLDAAIAKTQKIGSGEKLKRNNKNFLIVDKNGVGHLPVHDRQHAGMAWAALTTGFRGKKYSGPDKAKAMAKLRGIYHSHGWPLPGESDSSGS